MSKLVSLWGGPVSGHVADICAGSGALGFELLSRGASHATFVDIDLRYVHKNTQRLSAKEFTTLIRHDARRSLPPYHHNTRLDVIVADPPYGQGAVPTWVLGWVSWAEPCYTIICIEQEAQHTCDHIEGLSLLQKATYGRVVWTLWHRDTIVQPEQL